ncbi:MAG: phosphoribosylformylglycinamidine synthase subunit PurQ [Spirochaetota bacterium]|nr:MAG: phosphoribosylformylglycinamidine synthase subunit PurQ [Spirochaetota bacterium]
MKTTAPGALILTGYGINCDYESLTACRIAGFSARRIHLNDLLEETSMIFQSKLVVFPGGFSFGDDLGSGVAFSAKIRYSFSGLFDILMEYVEKGGLILGVCNGFQILIHLGMLPASGMKYGEKEATLAPNREGYYVDRWVYLKAERESQNVFTRGLDILKLPVRHSEGRFIPRDETILRRIERNRQVCLRYCDEDGNPTQAFPLNPNSSVNSIAGVCDPSGRVFGLMPHPEAATSFYHYPDWTKRREKLIREGASFSDAGEGALLFKNAFEFVK